jgi:hypothetical protein
VASEADLSDNGSFLDVVPFRTAPSVYNDLIADEVSAERSDEVAGWMLQAQQAADSPQIELSEPNGVEEVGDEGCKSDSSNAGIERHDGRTDKSHKTTEEKVHIGDSEHWQQCETTDTSERREVGGGDEVGDDQ